MIESPDHQVSIQLLIEQLCKSIYKDVASAAAVQTLNTTQFPANRPFVARHQSKSDKPKDLPAKFLKKCKLRSFEILLKKTARKSIQDAAVTLLDEGFSEVIDPLTELRCSQFEWNLYLGQMQSQFHAYGHVSERQKEKIAKRHAMFEECVNFVEKNECFCDEHSEEYGILCLLTLLKKSPVESMLTEHDVDESLFSLKPNQLVPLHTLEPFIFKLNWQENWRADQNPYCNETSLRILNGDCKALRMPLFTALASKQSARLFQSDFQPFNSTAESHQSLNELNELPIIQCKTNQQRFPNAIQYTSNKWEELGRRYILRKDAVSANQCSLRFEPKFASESSCSSMNLMAAQAIAKRQLFHASIVSMQQFITHTKSLLIGIESESFLYDAINVKFKLVENLTIANLLPGTVSHFVCDFIECGTCFKRLKLIIARNSQNFKLKYDGFLFKAMCGSFDKYLETFRRFVIFGQDQTIVELSLRMSVLIKQIRMLAKVLAIHPDNVGNEIPRGSEFLGYLYKQIIGVTQKDVSVLLVFILTECCDIYFRNFANWIFHGIIDDPSKELFIEYVNHYRPKTKFYFDKAYLIKPKSVPGFLHGWEQSVLLCGKYANLLKLYKPTHSLFTVTPPPISICLSFAQLQTVERECEDYKTLAKSVCGESLIISDIFKRRAEKQQAMAALIANKSRQDLERWRIERDVRANDMREQRERERALLLQQIQEIREQKIQKRREQLEADREYMRQGELAELELIARENEQRQRNIEYYTELGEIVDAQRKRAEMEVGDLQRQLNKQRDAMLVEKSDKMETSGNDDGSDDSIYYDAQKSPLSIKSDEFEILARGEEKTSIPRSASDYLNSNADLISDRMRNRANVLTSNICLTNDDNYKDNRPFSDKSMQPLTDAQKNKLKIFHQEYDFIGSDTNSNEIVVIPLSADLTDLQRNRNKVMAFEFGITTPTVAVPSVETCGRLKDFENNKKIAQGHCHTFNSTPDCDLNANTAPKTAITDLQRNRQKVLMQEFNWAPSKSTNEAAELIFMARNKLKSSLSLDLDNENKTKRSNVLSVKPCQSDFVNSPMSTTSDDLLAGPSTSDADAEAVHLKDGDEGSENANVICEKTLRTNLKLDCSYAKKVKESTDIDFTQFTADVVDRPTPFSALNTAGIASKQLGGFLFERSPMRQPTLSQMMRPTFTSTNIFDLSTQLNAGAKFTRTSTSATNAYKSLTASELQDLNIANLTNFLQQSFTIPLQAHLGILNNEILKIYFDDFDILSHFHSLRNYFFMMDGEFAANISDGLLTKLQVVRKPSELLNSHVLHGILENALQSSLIGNDKNAENLSFFIPNVPECFDMASPNVLNELHLSYKVDWPLNLLLSAETIEHYGRVFQHLIKLRRITWLLEQSFYKLKDIRKQSAEKIQQSPQFRHIQQMRHKLLCFINALQTHITSVALQGSWQLFQQDLESVKSMEDLYKKHTKYLKRVEFLCMLNKSSYDFFIKMEDIFVVVLRFCYNLQSKNWRCNDHGIYTHPKYDKLLQIETDFTNLITFIIYAGNKMSQCGYQTEIGEFIYMINLNGFYDNA